MGLPSQKSSNLSSNTASQQNIRRMNLRPSTFLNNIQKPVLLSMKKQESSPLKVGKQESSPTPSPSNLRVSLPTKMYTPLKNEVSETNEEKFFYIPKEPEGLVKPRDSSVRNRDQPSNTSSNNQAQQVQLMKKSKFISNMNQNFMNENRLSRMSGGKDEDDNTPN